MGKRVLATLLSVAGIMYVLISNFFSSERSLFFVVFVLPYLVSDFAVMIMLIISAFNNPKEVNANNKMFLISVLGSNLSILPGIIGLNIFGTNINPVISTIASILSVSILPFYLTAVITLGRNLTVLPEANNLKTDGVYKISRHPLYLTYIIWFILQVFICQSWLIVVTSIFQIALQLIRAKNEEVILEKNFPEYKEYASKVGWFLKPNLIIRTHPLKYLERHKKAFQALLNSSF